MELYLQSASGLMFYHLITSKYRCVAYTSSVAVVLDSILILTLHPYLYYMLYHFSSTNPPTVSLVSLGTIVIPTVAKQTFRSIGVGNIPERSMISDESLPKQSTSEAVPTSTDNGGIYEESSNVSATAVVRDIITKVVLPSVISPQAVRIRGTSVIIINVFVLLTYPLILIVTI